jgi:glycine betaine/proline transport system substrate-binding protein
MKKEVNCKLMVIMALFSILSVMIISCNGEHKSGKSTIRIAENPWTGSSINASMAKIILQEKMGYKVEIIKIDEYAQWKSIAKGDVDVCLEVWPSGHVDDVRSYINEKKTVDDIGLLGVVGKIGWYVPAYMLKEHPELSTWEGLKAPAVAALFKTDKSGRKGQFLTGDPSWVQYDGDIIKNLGLDLQVVKAGSEKAVLAAVDSAYRRKEPILFYFWTPHSIHAKYQLKEIKLPQYTDAGYANAGKGGVNCDYPPDILLKIAWPGLINKAPDAYEFLKNLNYTTQDQIEMLASVELKGKTPEAAVREWIEKNHGKWSSWLPVK